MKKALILIYVIGTAAFSFYADNAELQPALFWIALFAPHAGDTYPIVLVFLLTFLIFLLPLIVLLLIGIRIRKRNEGNQNVDGPGIWITRKRQLQSALVEIPVFINDVKVGGIDSGRIRFFAAPAGRNTVSAGTGLVASPKMDFSCSASDQPYFKLEIVQTGLIAKYTLAPIAPVSK